MSLQGNLILSLKSFRHAFNGIGKCLICERNIQLHLLATIIAGITALVLKVSISEGIALTIAVCFVWVAEIFNTCIERIMDMISLENSPAIGLIKDVSAAAGLVASFVALIIGLLIFPPKLK